MEPTAPPSRIDQALHILHACNAGMAFEKWVSVPGKDLDKLVVHVKKDARISIDTLCALLRAFPVCMRGPLLAKKTLIFEFLHDHNVDDAAITLINGVSKKRKAQAATFEDGDAERVLLANTLDHCLREHNSSTVCISEHRTGLDDRGRCHVFEISFPERFNLRSVVALYTHKDAACIKDMSLVIGDKTDLFVRPFAGSERRIVNEWEVVPKYSTSGFFVLFRHRTLRDVATP